MSGWSNVICNAHSGIVLQAKCDPKAGRARADAFFKGQVAISQFVMVVAPDDGLTALCIDPNDNTIHPKHHNPVQRLFSAFVRCAAPR